MLEGIRCPLGSSTLCLVMGTRPGSERAPAWGIHIWTATHLSSDLAEVQTYWASSGLSIAFSAVRLRSGFPIALHNCRGKKQDLLSVCWKELRSSPAPGTGKFKL